MFKTIRNKIFNKKKKYGNFKKIYINPMTPKITNKMHVGKQRIQCTQKH